MMQNKVDAIRQYAKEKLGGDRSGHDFYHVERVAKLAKKIALQEGCSNTELIEAVSYLHDVLDDKVFRDVLAEKEHLKTFLKNLNFGSENTSELLYIIENLSFSKEIESGKADLSLEGQIVQDADRIDALGAIGILRTAYYGGHNQSPLYDPNVSPRTLNSKKEYREEGTVINHFYEKLFRLPASMNTKAGKLEAEKRKAFMEYFLETFYSEWNLS